MPRSRYAYVIFDLDGTLADPGEAIFEAIKRTLAAFGRPEPDAFTLRSHIGPPLHEIYSSYGLGSKDVQAAIALHRSIFPKLADEHYRSYAGIPELLDALRSAGVKLALATSKFTPQAERIVEALGLGNFAAIRGEGPGDGASSKFHVLSEAITAEPEVSLAEIAMVGDRRFDLAAADRCGIDGVAVAYGFGTEEELAASAPRFLARSVKELRSYLLA